jgi:hypothetical protein
LSKLNHTGKRGIVALEHNFLLDSLRVDQLDEPHLDLIWTLSQFFSAKSFGSRSALSRSVMEKW